MRWQGLFVQKIVGLHALAKSCGTSTDALVARYTGLKLPNGDDKGTTFKNALTGSYTGSQALYLINACNLTHNKDNRTPLQYATDLIIGWLSEDAILTALNNNGWNATPTGSDKNRDFLTKDTITHTADIQTRKGTLELIFDYTNHWSQADKLDLRDNKKTHLQNNNITLMGIAPRSGKGLLITPEELDQFIYGEIPAYGKTGWTLTGVSQILKPLPELLAA